MDTDCHWGAFRRSCIDPFTPSRGVLGTVSPSRSPIDTDPAEMISLIGDCKREPLELLQGLWGNVGEDGNPERSGMKSSCVSCRECDIFALTI